MCCRSYRIIALLTPPPLVCAIRTSSFLSKVLGRLFMQQVLPNCPCAALLPTLPSATSTVSEFLMHCSLFTLLYPTPTLPCPAPTELLMYCRLAILPYTTLLVPPPYTLSQPCPHRDRVPLIAPFSPYPNLPYPILFSPYPVHTVAEFLNSLHLSEKLVLVV